MTGNEYLNNVLKKYDKNYNYNTNEENVFNSLKKTIQQWFDKTHPLSSYSWNLYNRPTLEVQKSGSRAKGTAIKGSSDMDMFLSITDRENEDRIKDYYEDIYDFLKERGFQVRKQNVSIGLQYCGFSIDIVPAKKSNQQSYKNDIQAFNDHWLWSNKLQKRTKTNIQRHIDLVKNNHIEPYVMLTKIWRNNHNLDFPSIYIEILVNDALVLNMKNDLAYNFVHVLKYIRDNIDAKKVVDPSNSVNIISDTLTLSEKRAIKKSAENSLIKSYWEQIIW